MVPSDDTAGGAVETALEVPLMAGPARGDLGERGGLCTAKRYPGCRGGPGAEGSSEVRWWLFRLATGSQEFRSCSGTVFGRQFLLSLPLSFLAFIPPCIPPPQPIIRSSNKGNSSLNPSSKFVAASKLPPNFVPTRTALP